MVDRPIQRIGPRTVRRFGGPVTVTNAEYSDNVSKDPTSTWDQRDDTNATTTSTVAQISQESDEDYTGQTGEGTETVATIYLLASEVEVYDGDEADDRKATRIADDTEGKTYEVLAYTHERNGLVRCNAREV